MMWHKKCQEIDENQQNIDIWPKNQQKKGEYKEISSGQHLGGGYHVSCLRYTIFQLYTIDLSRYFKP